MGMPCTVTHWIPLEHANTKRTKAGSTLRSCQAATSQIKRSGLPDLSSWSHAARSSHRKQ